MALAPPYVEPGPSLSDMVPPHVLAAIHFSRPPEITAKVEERKQIREKMNLSKKDAMDRLRRYVEKNPGTNPTDDIPGINDGLSKRQRQAAMNNIRGPIPAKEGCVLLYPPPFTDVRTLTHLDLLPRDPHSWGKLRLFTLLNKLRGIPFEQLTLQHCETMHQLAVLAHAKLDAPIRSLRKRLLAPPPPPVEEKDLPPSCVLMHPPPLTDPNDVTPYELEGAHVINEWPVEKKYEVLNKLRGIPHHLLTLEHSLSIFRIAKRLKVKLEETLVQRTDKIFLDDKVAKYLENYRAEAAAAEAEGNKLPEEELMKRALAAAAADKRKVLPSVPKKQKFDYIPDFYADCNEYKKFDQQRKWVLFNAMRAIPLEELDRQACHKIAMLGSHMKVALSAAFHQRREELIGKKLIPVGPTCPPVAAPGFLPPHQIATPSLPVQIGPIQPPKPRPPPLPEAPPGQHPPVSFQDVVNAERSRVEDPVAEWNQPRDWNRPQSANGRWNQEYCGDVDLRRQPQRPYYEEPQQNYYEEGPPHPYAGRPEEPRHPYHRDQIGQPSAVNPIAFSNPTPPPVDAYNDPYNSYHQPEWGVPPADFDSYLPRRDDPSNYSHREWLRQQQMEQERARLQDQLDQQLQMQQQQQTMDGGARRPDGSYHSPMNIDRREERPQLRVTHRVGRSPSPKRRREMSPMRSGDGAPPLQPAEVKVPLVEMVNWENYVLEEPMEKIETVHRKPMTVQDMQAISDLVYLCQNRDAPVVTQPFLHPASRVILYYICEYLGEGYKLEESSSTKNLNIRRLAIPEKVRSQAVIWIGGISRLITLGEGVDVEQGQATKFAYASAMAALCYMMIVPYHLYLILKNSGPEYVDVILRACKPRIRNKIAVSREPVFGPLATYKGGLQEVPDYIGNIWGTFINKMRHSGMEYWDCNIIPIPRHMTGFTGAGIPEFYFICEQDDNYNVSWTDMAPVPGEISSFDDADFRRTFACSRFIQSPAEKGVIPPQNLQSWLDSPYSYELKHKNPLVSSKNFDPIVHLPFRDLLYNYGIGSRTTPMFTLFFLKLIGARWNRNLVVKHQLEIDIKEGKERWKHVVTLSFEGVPAVFLGGKCRRDTFASALIHAGGIIAEQLSNLMIIPQELCYFVQKQARTWGSIVIYVCRERFAAFEALVRNPMYTQLHSVPSATLDFKNPLYKLAESFFWRMRSTGYPYWVDHRTRLMVPVSFEQKPQLPEDAFFSCDLIYQQPTWESINATVDRIDYFEMSVLKIEDRMWTVWEGGERGQEMVKTIAPVTPPQPSQPAQTTVSPGIWFENALSSEYNMPLTSLTFADCTMVLKLLRCLAAASCEKGLELKITKNPTPTGHEQFHCNVAWSGMLSWILNASFDSYLERDIEFGAAWELYRLMIKMAIVPPGLFEFVVNNETRLPYVVSSLVPFLRLLESCLPQFTENSHCLLMEQMKRLALVEWLSRKIQLPPQLIPNSEEQRRLPFVLVEEMSPRTQEIWDATYGQEPLGAVKPVEEPRQPVIHQVAYQPQPEYHANLHFTPPVNVVENYSSQGMPPPKRRRSPVVQQTAVPEPAASQLPPREDPPVMGSWMPVLQAPRPIKQAVVPQEVEKAPVAHEDRATVSVQEAEQQKQAPQPAPEANPIVDPPAPPVFAPEPTPEDDRIFMTPTFVPMKKPTVEEESMEEEAIFYSSVEGSAKEPLEAQKETLSFEDDKMEEDFEDQTLPVEASTSSESDVIVLQPPVPQEAFSHKINAEIEEENDRFLQSHAMSSESAPQVSSAPPDATTSGYHNFDSGDDDGEDEYL